MGPWLSLWDPWGEKPTALNQGSWPTNNQHPNERRCILSITHTPKYGCAHSGTQHTLQHTGAFKQFLFPHPQSQCPRAITTNSQDSGFTCTLNQNKRMTSHITTKKCIPPNSSIHNQLCHLYTINIKFGLAISHITSFLHPQLKPTTIQTPNYGICANPYRHNTTIDTDTCAFGQINHPNMQKGLLRNSGKISTRN